MGIGEQPGLNTVLWAEHKKKRTGGRKRSRSFVLKITCWSISMTVRFIHTDKCVLGRTLWHANIAMPSWTDIMCSSLKHLWRPFSSIWLPVRSIWTTECLTFAKGIRHVWTRVSRFLPHWFRKLPVRWLLFLAWLFCRIFQNTTGSTRLCWTSCLPRRCRGKRAVPWPVKSGSISWWCVKRRMPT